ATWHERRTLERAFFAARYAHTYEVNSCALQFSFASLGVGEERISAVDDHIPFLEQRRQLSDYGIDGRPRFHHHHGDTGFFKRPDKFLQRAGGLVLFFLAAFSAKFFRDLSGAIEHRDRKTLRFHVQDEIFAHDTGADQA